MEGDMMKIAHICTSISYVIMKSYIRFINEEFNSENHDFIVIGENKGDKFFNFPSNDKFIRFNSLSKDYFAIVKLLKSYDKILLHSFAIPTIIQPLYFANKELKSKTFWVAWGYDLYEWMDRNKGFKNRLRNYINLNSRQKVKYFVGIFPPDIKFFKNEFNTKAETFYASYTGNLYNPIYNKDLVNKSLSEKIENNDCINILIGHSSSNKLNHFEVLKDIEKYSKENIRVFIPLSYGNMTYGDEVQERAKEKFGDKVVCLREMMDKDKYMELLSTIDIAIFNTTRQIGLGNISPMLYMDKKIYMPKGSVMYDFYKSQKIDIWDYYEIDKFDYCDFIQPLKFKGGRKYIVDNELNLKHKVDMWNKVFEAPLK